MTAGGRTEVLTFVLTDVEGSASAWERDPAAMRAALERLTELVEAAAGASGGELVRAKGEGDSHFCVFRHAPAAVAAAVALQRALVAEPWPTAEPVRVRIGVHTGEAHVADDDYLGSSVNRCARLRGLAAGGQTFVSSATAALVSEQLPPGVALHDIGVHHLRGLSQPERVFAVADAGLPGGGSVAGPPATGGNLPVRRSSFVGRQRLLGDVADLVEGRPLVTLVGPGGAGKTRLAEEVARQVAGRFDGGAWLVELGPLRDAALVAQAAATALGLREEQGRPPLDAVVDHLAGARALVLLDNCEHLLDGAAAVAAAISARCPGVRVLATSREPLALDGEQVVDVPPLEVAGPRSEAARLFVERAQAHVPGFTPSDEESAAIARVCARLDGLPLAVELAAARVRALPVTEIEARLTDRLRLLTAGHRLAEPRQQTLRGSIAWSWDLLDEAERALLARLSVFAGPFPLAAVEAVCAGGAVDEDAVVDLVAALVTKSLVVRAGARFQLLETIRSFAADELEAAGETAAWRDAHLDWYRRRALEAEPELSGERRLLWFEEFDADIDNIRSALEWSYLAPERAADGISLAYAIRRYWDTRAHFSEGRRWLELLLDRATDLPPDRRADALHSCGVLAVYQGDRHRAAAHWRESLAIRRDIDDLRGISLSLNNLAAIEDDIDVKRGYLEEALELARRSGRLDSLAGPLFNLGQVARDSGDHGGARRLFAESLDVARRLGDLHWHADPLAALGELDLLEQRFGDAVADYEALRAVAEQGGDVRNVARAERGLGSVAWEQGDTDGARRHLERSLELLLEANMSAQANRVLHALGEVARADGDRALAARRLDEALALSDGDPRAEAAVRCSLGNLALDQGDIAAAAAHHARSLSTRRALGRRADTVESIEGIAAVAAMRGEGTTAARLLGAAAAARQAIAAPVLRSGRPDVDRAVAAARRALGTDDAFTAAVEEGGRLTFEEALAVADAAVATPAR